VLDPFAGGGAIPLEAMRLGCEATAIDINPVAWFILKCTLEYPQRLAGQRRPLPDFALQSPEFMAALLKGAGDSTNKRSKANRGAPQDTLFPPPDADLSWHVRAWGWWVLQRAKADLERFYHTVNGKPTVAYLWARTVKCKNCRALIPLLKTRWLCKKDNKRVLLTVEPNPDATGVVFGVHAAVPVAGGNSAQRREHDKRLGQGTMSRTGAWCPCCGKAGTVAMTLEDIRQEGLAGGLGAVMTAVVVDGKDGKEYRLPTPHEIRCAAEAEKELDALFAEIPFELPTEPLPSKEALGFRVPLYGLDQWRKLFTPRQLLALGTFLKHTRAARKEMPSCRYPPDWLEAIPAYLAVAVDRAANYLSCLCIWEPVAAEIKQTFLRFAPPITWDFGEANPLSLTDRYYLGALSNIGLFLDKRLAATMTDDSLPSVVCRSALHPHGETFDLLVTDPPYYDAIPYADLMDFFCVWLRRALHGLSPDIDHAFGEPLSPKWNHECEDGELIDDASRHGGDSKKSKAAYEQGMFRAFQCCNDALRKEGRLVIVFAHKQPDAWETLVSAIIRSGFVVDGSWPVVTEMRGGVRNFGRASLASSVWLVCRKRPDAARPGWDNRVLEEMRENIGRRLREYWGAGIRGPDFVWAATGPALEAYSKHPVVKKANEPGEVMEVPEFLRAVRGIVVDFVVGRVLSRDGGAEAATGLDDLRTYYLLHRHDFGMDEAPIGACILYAVSCGLSDTALGDQLDILVRAGGHSEASEDEDENEREDDDGPAEGSGNRARLRPWEQRTRKSMGYDAEGRPAPLIDQVHLWKAGDARKVDDYLDTRGLRRNALFHQLIQALIELAPNGSEERTLLESLSNHVVARGVAPDERQPGLPGVAGAEGRGK
jgi:adenine-specific DNA methylase